MDPTTAKPSTEAPTGTTRPKELVTDPVERSRIIDKHVARIKDHLSRPLTPEEIAEANEWMRQVEEGSKHLQGKTHTELHFGMNVIHGTGKYPPVDDTPRLPPKKKEM